MISLNCAPKTWALALAGVLYPVLIVSVVNRLAAIPFPRQGFLPPDITMPLSVALAVVALVNVLTPWARRDRWREAHTAGAGGDPDFRSLILGLPLTAAPASYGLLLYVLTGQAALVPYFAGASFLAALAWDAQALISQRPAESQ